MTEPAARQPSPAMSSRHAYYALFVLWMTNLLGNIDRFSVGLILQQIKVDLQLTDTQIGILSGAAFVVAYTVFGFPIARWLDRGNRRNILAWSVGVWSMMAVAFGSAANFVQIVLARAGLGAGEAACIPGAVSLIGDYFKREKRTQAIGVLHSALAVAGIIGNPLVGVLTDQFGWRVAVISFGVIGLFLALVVRWTISEPPRLSVRSETLADGSLAGRDTFLRAMRVMFSNKAFLFLLIGHATYGIGIYAFVSWYPVTLVRAYGLTYTDIGLYIGTWMGIAMLIASLASGWICPAIARRMNDDRWLAILPAIFCLLSVPAMALVSMDVSQPVALIAGGVVLFMTVARTPVMLSLALDLVPASMHSLGTLVVVIVTTSIGAAVGPILVGLISDSVVAEVGSSAALRHGLLLTAPVFGLLGALLAFLPARFMARKLVQLPA
ncbi:MAG: MFS transporter [Proteobacteria bacterium]|nr:MFS transporter [Pseudomonadota bacterium]